MAVDLFDLVETLRRAVNAPGEEVFPNATDEVYAGYLSDAFWEIRMLNMLTQWTEGEGSVTPIAVSSGEMPRELQQLIVLFAGINIITNQIKSLDTMFRAKAGPVEFETQKSGNLLKDVLAELQSRRAIVERYLFGIGMITDAYIDSVAVRSEGFGVGWWIR